MVDIGWTKHKSDRFSKTYIYVVLDRSSTRSVLVDVVFNEQRLVDISVGLCRTGGKSRTRLAAYDRVLPHRERRVRTTAYGAMRSRGVAVTEKRRIIILFFFNYYPIIRFLCFFFFSILFFITVRVVSSPLNTTTSPGLENRCSVTCARRSDSVWAPSYLAALAPGP